MTDGLLRVAPESEDIDPARIRAFLTDVAAEGRELHSMMLHRGRGVVAEGWWAPYRPDRVHSVHSVTKSFTSTAIGLAVDEGRFGLDDRVAEFFPARSRPDEHPLQAEMTVEHLLTQRSGHAAGVSGAVWRKLRTSWVDEFFKVPVPLAPGTHFVYSSATSFLLSAIITETTGSSLADYLTPRLFEPLGFADVRWDVGPEGINPGGNGVSCTTADLLKLGVLYLHQGRWGNRQVLPGDWTRSAVRDVHGDGYGYHWWVAPQSRAFLAFGAFGQYVFVFPEHDAVLVLTGAVPGITGTALPELVWRHFPALLDERHQLPTKSSPTLLGLQAVPRPVGKDAGSARLVSGRWYAMEPNEDGVSAIRFDFADERCRCTVIDGRGEHTVVLALEDWHESDTTMSGAALHHGYEPGRMRVVAGGAWSGADTFVMTWQFVETPFRDTVTVSFHEGTLTWRRAVNVNSGPMSRPVLRGGVSPC